MVVYHLPLRVLGLQEAQVRLPFVADDLATGEAPDRNDHLGKALFPTAVSFSLSFK